MGKGKGGVEGWVAVVKHGRILFEIGGADDAIAIRALELAAQKLPVSTKIITAAAEV
jgi:large subunit ribosomal protein L16